MRLSILVSDYQTEWDSDNYGAGKAQETTKRPETTDIFSGRFMCFTYRNVSAEDCVLGPTWTIWSTRESNPRRRDYESLDNVVRTDIYIRHLSTFSRVYIFTSEKNRLCCLATANTFRTCFSFKAMGFSHNTCLPASSILIDNETWSLVTVLMYTTSEIDLYNP